MKTKRQRRMRAAGKAAGWVRDIAAVKPGTKNRRAKHKMRGFFKARPPSEVRQFSPDEIASVCKINPSDVEKLVSRRFDPAEVCAVFGAKP